MKFNKQICTLLLIGLVSTAGARTYAQQNVKMIQKKETNEKMEANAGTHLNALFGLGSLNEAYAQYFIGKSYVNPIFTPTPENPMAISNVTFEPGCRNNWHIHSTEQILLVTDGTGWYQEDGLPARLLHAGDTVVIKAGVKHWHGASADSSFAHIAISNNVLSGKTDWLEPVSDEEYMKLGK